MTANIRKLYPVLDDAEAEAEGLIRVIDESGDDYLYPAPMFEKLTLYSILEQTQKGSMDVTPWLDWFLGCLGRAIDGAQSTVQDVLAKARFWERLQGIPWNGRQRLVRNRLLDGFEGKLTTSKYAKLAKCSHDHGPFAIFSPLSNTPSCCAGPKAAEAPATRCF